MQRVTFAVTYDGELAHPVHRRVIAGHAVTRMELLQWGPTAAVTTLSWYDGGEDAVADLLSAVDSTTAQRLVPAADGTYAFARQSGYELGERVLDVVDRAAVVFRPPVVFEASGDARFEAVGESDHLSAFYDALSTVLPTRIERVGAFRRWPAPATLTERQRAALEAAVAVGYYDIPRTGSIDDVAAELNCAHSTAGELVRKAEAAVVTGTVPDPTGRRERSESGG